MDEEIKRYSWIAGILEFIYFVLWLWQTITVMTFKTETAEIYSSGLNFFSAYDVLTYHDSLALKLFGYGVVLVIAGWLGPSLALRHAFENYQHNIGMLLLVINTILIIVLLLAMANPILFALAIMIAVGALAVISSP